MTCIAIVNDSINTEDKGSRSEAANRYLKNDTRRNNFENQIIANSMSIFLAIGTKVSREIAYDYS